MAHPRGTEDLTTLWRGDGADTGTRGRVAPGRVTLTSQLAPRPVQAKSAVQRRADRTSGARELDLDGVHDTAARGVAGGGGPLPFLDQIQQAFGRHDVSGIQAHTGGAAAAAAGAIGAQAYAVGNQVAFGGAPDLHTAAHEAAHVIQQRRGVSLKGGVGAEGDAYEHHADAVADRVVRGESVEALLDGGPGGGGGTGVQRKNIFERVTEGLSGAQATFATYVASILPGNSMAAQLVASVSVDDKLSGLLNELGVQIIKYSGVDAMLAGAIATGASGGAAATLGVLAALDHVVAIWNAVPEPLQQVVIFLAGYVLQRVENYVVGVCRWVVNRAKEEAHKDGDLQTHAIATWLLEPLASSTGFSVKYVAVSKTLQQFLTGLPVTTLWRDFGAYVTDWIVAKGWVAFDWIKSWFVRSGGGSVTPVVEPSDEPKALDAPKGPDERAPVAKAPSRIPVGPMAILPKKFGIAATTKKESGEVDKLGGMEIAAGLEFGFLSSKNAIPEINGKARVDWNGKFSWDVALTNLQLLKSADLGFLSIENIMLDRLQATDEFMELGMSASKLKIGSFLTTEAIRFSWNSKSGLYLALDTVSLVLPDPVGTVTGNLQLGIGADGKLKQLELAKFSAGKDASFTIEKASYVENRFSLDQARYKLPKDALGTDASVSVSAEVSKTGGLEKLSGTFTVDALKPMGDDTVVIGGGATLGYSTEDGFFFGLDNANFAVNTSVFKGHAALSARFKTKTKALTGTLTTLELGTPLVTLWIANARFSNKDADGYQAGIFADSASITLGGTNNEEAENNVKALSPGGWSSALSALRFAGQFVKAKVIKPQYTKAGGVTWTGIETPLALPDAASISLFGGRITGMYDRKKRTAALGAHFAYDPLPLPKLVAEYHFVPALGVFVEFGLFGGVSAGVEGKVTQAKEEDPIDLSGTLKLAGHIGVKLAGGFMIGSNYIAALRAALEGTATLTATADAAFKGQLYKPEDSPIYRFKPSDKDGVAFTYDLKAALTAQLALVVDATLFMVHTKQLARFNLKTWELGQFHVAGKFKEDESGKLTHVLDRPNTNKEKDPTLGGAFESTPKLDPAALTPVPVEEAIDELAAAGEKFTDEKLANRLLTDLEEATHLMTLRKEGLRAKIKGATTVKGPELAKMAKTASDYKAGRKLDGLDATSRIMVLEQWKEYSDIGLGRRVKVVAVDEAVSAYHAIPLPKGDKATPDAQRDALALRMAALTELEARCGEYIGNNGDRAQMVGHLLAACVDEREQLIPFLERARKAATTVEFTSKVESSKQFTDKTEKTFRNFGIHLQHIRDALIAYHQVTMLKADPESIRTRVAKLGEIETHCKLYLASSENLSRKAEVLELQAQCVEERKQLDKVVAEHAPPPKTVLRMHLPVDESSMESVD